MREGSAPNFCPPTEEGITLTGDAAQVFTGEIELYRAAGTHPAERGRSGWN